MRLPPLLPGIRKSPPAIKSPLLLSPREYTVPLMVDPIGDQVVPSQREMYLETGSFSTSRLPAAIRCPLESRANECTSPTLDANGTQLEPLHRTRVVAVGSDVPATASPFGNVDSDRMLPVMPTPILDHPEPFHLATRLAVLPPANENSPPTKMSPLERMVSARTAAFTPDPRGDHLTPSHRAMRLSSTLAANVKSPPAMTSPLGSCTNTRTAPFNPESIGVQSSPAHRISRFVFTA
jgi:hypothetical protein